MQPSAISIKILFCSQPGTSISCKNQSRQQGRKWHSDAQKCRKPSACLDTVKWGFHLRDRAKWADLLPGAELPPVRHLTGSQEDLGSPVVDSLVQNPPGNKEKRKAPSRFAYWTAALNPPTLSSLFFYSLHHLKKKILAVREYFPFVHVLLIYCNS